MALQVVTYVKPFPLLSCYPQILHNELQAYSKYSTHLRAFASVFELHSQLLLRHKSQNGLFVAQRDPRH